MPTEPNVNPQTLDPSQHAASSEQPSSDLRLKRMVETFKTDLKDITGNHKAGENFEKMIEASPYAKELLLKAIDQGNLTRFVHDDGSSVYDREKKTISFNARDLEVIDRSEPMFAQKVGTLGHEAYHATNREVMEKVHPKFFEDLGKAMHSDQLIRGADGKYRQADADITQALKNVNAANRMSEAGAELANFNSVSSMLKAQNNGQTPSLGDIYRVTPESLRSYMEEYKDASGSQRLRMREGFELNTDMTLSYTPKNLEAAAKIFYDSKDQTSLIGHSYGTDYTNFYCRRYVQSAINVMASMAEDAPKDMVPQKLRINMKEVGLDEKMLEKYLDLPNGKPFVYYDTSSGKPVKSTFDPYVEKKDVAPTTDKPAIDKPTTDPKPSNPGKGGKGPDPGEPDIGMHAEPGARATNPVERLSERQRTDLGVIDGALARDGRWDTHSARNIASDLLLQVSSDSSVKEVQRVAFSDPTPNARVFAMYSLSEDRGPHFHVSVHGPTSAQRDANTTLEQVAALNKTSEQGLGREQALVQQNAQTTERAQGPRLA